MSADPLIERWRDWLGQAALHDEDDRHCRKLFRRYLDPARHYHNLDHTAIPSSEDEQLLCDIDLSILGKPPDVFAAYERAIRQEYARVSDEAFRAGRATVLRHFLLHRHIYCTRSFRDRYESFARRNLERSLNRLEMSM